MTSAPVIDRHRPPGAEEFPLFSRFPRLRTAVPRVPLGSWPTPVERLTRLADGRDVGELWVKHDDVSALPYGGNKVRKLEILLADALEHGARHVFTFGAAGSNHALATAIYGRQLGLAVTSFLTPQPNAAYVRRNLLAHAAVGASVRMHASRDEAMRDAATLRADIRAAGGVDPYVIPFGGTSPLSTSGVVNAGLELSVQIAAGELPEPEFVYVPLGSMGTVAGVALGLALGGHTPVVRAVRVVPEVVADEAKLAALMRETATLLKAADPGFPGALDTECRVEIVSGFLGEEYARFTREGMAAVHEAANAEDLHLEGTYSGKTMAALLATAASGEFAGENVVFWDTYNSRDLTALTAGVDYHSLPEECHVFFETDVQPLDRVEA